VADQSVSVPMTLSNFDPDFKVTTFFEVEYLVECLRDRVTIAL